MSRVNEFDLVHTVGKLNPPNTGLYIRNISLGRGFNNYDWLTELTVDE
jgi:hypothetical protein